MCKALEDLLSNVCWNVSINVDDLILMTEFPDDMSEFLMIIYFFVNTPFVYYLVGQDELH